MSDVSDLSEGRQQQQDRKVDRISVKPFIYQIEFRKGYTNQNSEWIQENEPSNNYFN